MGKLVAPIGFVWSAVGQKKYPLKFFILFHKIVELEMTSGALKLNPVCTAGVAQSISSR